MTPSEKALKALAGTEISLFAQDLDLRYRWCFNTEGSWLAGAQPGCRDEDFLSQAESGQAAEIKRGVILSGRRARFELRVASPDGVRWFDVRLDADRDAQGQIQGLVGSSVEITAQKKREETLKSLLRELSHRSKNLLAIIQSLASQTARHSVTIPEFLVRFRGRIQSLSSSQDIVTEADWRGADLSNLVTMQVERYAPDGMTQVRFEGPDVYLSPTAALHVGLALHELAVNAASYGSLSIHGGKVLIRSDFLEREGQRYLRLRWQEKAGPLVPPEHDTRFGTSTLERIVPNSVGGEAILSYQPEGVSYSLLIPESQFERIDGPR
ncbi:PAS domain-containing sensor histidine kinase [Aureimonas populi]|uniref:histidine kinase n=1 Tax=Aureimonas populi TaxID=1701758 RepID=A0ABW5CGD7_9HYPH|nr:PAS domain-containing sensor histidine kinase [Aureimonas populi]